MAAKLETFFLKKKERPYVTPLIFLNNIIRCGLVAELECYTDIELGSADVDFLFFFYCS